MNAIAPMPIPATPPAREPRTDSTDAAASDPADKRFSDLLGDAPGAAKTAESSPSKVSRKQDSKDEPAEPENSDATPLLWLSGIEPAIAPKLTGIAGNASSLLPDDGQPSGDPAPVPDNSANAGPNALPTPLMALLAAVDAGNPATPPVPPDASGIGKAAPAPVSPAANNPAALAALAALAPDASATAPPADKPLPLQIAQALPAANTTNFADEIKLATRLLQDLAPADDRAAAPPSQLPAANELRPATAPALVPGPPADLRGGNFDQQIGKHLLWMSEQRIDQATIQVSPEHLGPLEVRLRMDGDKVFAQFSSAHSEVRQVLETAMPRLRDMLGAQGLTLAQADVGQQGQWQPPAHDNGGPGRGTAGVDALGDSEIGGTLRQTPKGLSARILRLLDEYA